MNKSVLEKNIVDGYHIVFLYQGKFIPKFKEIDQSMKTIFYEIIRSINQDHNPC
ncbi:MAG: hypothetical protein LBQ72_01825 [Flavobacteriales bacterium]|nr:hypothetical protein [Flavobacteriales bacterium]